MTNEHSRHWDDAYGTRGTTGVSWFEAVPLVSLELVELLSVHPDAAVIDIGGGSSFFAESLIERGFTDLSVLDISETALAAARLRLAARDSVAWVHADVMSWRPERQFDLWHDRAVFHFLVDTTDRDAYLNLLKGNVMPGGSVVVGTFAEKGPEYCSGLPVARYSADQLASLLGEEFEVVHTRSEEHITPAGGVQPFTWVAARRAGVADRALISNSTP